MLNTLREEREGGREGGRKRRREEENEGGRGREGEREGGRKRRREGGILVVTGAPLKYFCLGRVTFGAGLHNTVLLSLVGSSALWGT